MRVMSAPLFVAWNYTYTCNFNCTHCYSRAPWFPEELSTEEYTRLAREMADMGVFRVALGGGEPLLRQDCLKIIKLMSTRGMDVFLTSHGWHLDASRASSLAEAGLRRLYISLDSSHAVQHDRFRRQIGSFDRALRSIAVAVDAGLDVYLSTVVVQKNAHEMADLCSLADQLGASGIEFKRFRPAGNGVAFAKDYSLTKAKNREMSLLAQKLNENMSLHISLINGPETSIDGTATVGCACSVKSICIRPNGDVAPCVYSDIVVGNLKEKSLKTIWSTSDDLTLLREIGDCKALQTVSFPSNPTAKKFSSRRDYMNQLNS